MSQPLWSKLLVLVDIDNEINKLEKKVATSQELIATGKAQIILLSKDKDKKEQASKEIQKQITLTELEINNLNSQKTQYQNKLENASVKNELSSLEFELKTINKNLQKLEDDLVNQWQELEVAKRGVASQEELIAKENENLSISINELEKTTKELKASIDKASNKREKQLEEIPKEWLDMYNKMRNKAENPLVHIVNSSCSHCFYHVLPQDLMRIKRGKLMHCKSCFRLLYYPSDQTTTSEEASY